MTYWFFQKQNAGLNNSLQRLGKYAKKWKLKISQKKTKIMVFNKQGRSIDLKLKIDNLVIESCKKYVYLGIVFTPGNNFRTAQKELYKKTCKTLFTYLSVINVHTGAQISTVKNLFDTLVRPVLLYNSELWGAFLRPNNWRHSGHFLILYLMITRIMNPFNSKWQKLR